MTKEVSRKEIKKKTKGEARKKDKEEEETAYEIEKLLNDQKFKGVCEIEVKCKDDVNTT